VNTTSSCRFSRSGNTCLHASSRLVNSKFTVLRALAMGRGAKRPGKYTVRQLHLIQTMLPKQPRISLSDGSGNQQLNGERIIIWCATRVMLLVSPCTMGEDKISDIIWAMFNGTEPFDKIEHIRLCARLLDVEFQCSAILTICTPTYDSVDEVFFTIWYSPNDDRGNIIKVVERRK